MKTIIVIHRGKEIARVKHAKTLFQRLLGLMGRRTLPEDGILLDPCNSIHMMFMRIPIDVVALRQVGDLYRVVDVVHNAKPWQWIRPFYGATQVLELAPGLAANIRIDDVICLQTSI